MSSQESRESAWRIHQALGEWTARVDTKASFALTLESAALAGIVALSDNGHIFDNLAGVRARAVLWLGIALIMTGAIFAVLVVVPRLRKKKTLREEATNHFVYFGHLQFWKQADLAQKLEQADMLPVLSGQLIRMSEIAWKKHRFVQLSFGLAGLGALLVIVASYLR